MTDSYKLKASILKKQLTMREVAAVLQITPYSLAKKINNVTEFKASEIGKLVKLLDICEIDEIFFNQIGDLHSTAVS